MTAALLYTLALKGGNLVALERFCYTNMGTPLQVMCDLHAEGLGALNNRNIGTRCSLCFVVQERCSLSTPVINVIEAFRRVFFPPQIEVV